MHERTMLDAIIDALIDARPMTITILDPTDDPAPTGEPTTAQPPRRRLHDPRRGG